MLRGYLTQALAQVLRALRPREKALQQRTQVKAGSTDHDRQLAATGDPGNRCSRLPSVFARGEGFAGIGYVDQVMWNQFTFGAGRLCGANLKVAIDRNRIAANDLTLKPLRQGDCQRALSGRR